jgi:hypothetical protein
MSTRPASDLIGRGLVSDRPASGDLTLQGRIYIATDENKLYRDSGSVWNEVVATPSPHDHNDIYYTEVETDALLLGKADQTEVDTLSAEVALKADDADLAAHVADTTAAHAATAVSVTPFSTITSTNVQAALEEVLADLSATGSLLTVEEVDGTPTDAAVVKIVFPNGTLSIVGHVATYTPAAAIAQRTTLNFVIDGGGVAITTGLKGVLELPWDGTIQRVTLLADQSGSIVVDLWRDSYANHPPTVADTITAAAKPTISAANKAQNTALTGWTTTFAAGDILAVNVDSATNVQRVTLSLLIERTA